MLLLPCTPCTQQKEPKPPGPQAHHNRHPQQRTPQLITGPRSHYQWTPSKLIFTPERNLTRELTSRLAHCQWIDQATNVAILGKSSVGNTYLACALLHEACKKDYTAKFFRTADLAAQLAVLEHGDPARLKFINLIVGCDLLVLDGFLTTPISGETANELFNLLAAREGRGSTMITSQFEPDEWYDSMPDRVVAESLLNRLVGGAEIVNIDGPNMRLKPTIS